MGRKRQSTKKKRSTHKKRHFRNSTRRVRKGGDDGIYSPDEYNEPFANSGVPIDKKQMIQNYKKQFNADRSKKNELRTKMIEDGFTVEETVPVLGKYLDNYTLMQDINYMQYNTFYKLYNRLLNYGRDRKNENLFYAVYNRLYDDQSKIYKVFRSEFGSLLEDPPTVVKEVEYCKKRNCINTGHYLWGITPLHLAAIVPPRIIDFTNYGRVIREEDKKVFISVQDDREESERIINYLIDNGADVNAVDDYGNTPLLYAALLNNPNIDENPYVYTTDIQHIIELLINKGAKINKHNWFKITPLMWASKKSRPEMIEIMIDKGADINARTDSGRTALDFAKKENNEGVVALLQHNGAKSYRKL